MKPLNEKLAERKAVNLRKQARVLKRKKHGDCNRDIQKTTDEIKAWPEWWTETRIMHHVKRIARRYDKPEKWVFKEIKFYRGHS